MKKYSIVLLCLLAICLWLPLHANAQAPAAQDLTASTAISGSGYAGFGFLQDGNVGTFRSSDGSCAIMLENSAGIGSLYLYFDLEYGAYTIVDNETGKEMTAGQYGFLHEFVDLQAGLGRAPASVTLQFESGAVRLSEIYSFSVGQTPDYVQKWTPPLEGGADLVLFSTHSDDDQLFFAGLIPQYAGTGRCRVQVVLMTDHRKGAFATNGRTHEVINGLWATGLTAYPVFGDFLDYRLDDMDAMFGYYAQQGIHREEIQGFVVEQLRRFRPQVAVGHDLNGEYGHGMHKIWGNMLASGVELAKDVTVFPDSAERYGVWTVRKTYLHLYPENPIILDYDQPLAAFDGLTAFQASQKLGFPCHHSQQWTWFKQWLNGSGGEITSVTQIDTYNPAHFGLYSSTVGPDVRKDDFLENIVTYAQQDADAAAAVDQQIRQLPAITLESEIAIGAARSAYASLTPAQQRLVTALRELEAAETALAQLQQQHVADLAAAQQVVEQIRALGEIRLESEAAVVAAQAAYDGLTPAQQALVENVQLLRQAQHQLSLLQQEAQQARQALERARLRKQLLVALLALALSAGVLVILLRRMGRGRHRK